MTKHSDKAMKTLAAMNTVATDWKQTDIKWVKEMRTVAGWVQCPVCEGKGSVRSSSKTEYLPVTRPTDVPDWKFYMQNDLFSMPCRNCRTTKNWNMPTGSVRAMVQREVTVGYPQWPAGTKFDSRFRTTVTERYCCELCSKSLSYLQVPCVGTGSDGVTHGMWVGTDCAKKFLPGLYIYPPKKGDKPGRDYVMGDK